MLRMSIVLLVLVTFIIPTTAQDTEGYEILFYAGEQINVLTADGLAEPVELPAEARNIMLFTGLSYIQLSPDGDTLAFVNFDEEGNASTIQIADLEANTCCRVVSGPEGMNTNSVILGPFNEDGTHFTANFAQVYTADGPQAVLALVDAESAAITQSINLIETVGDPGAIFQRWTEDGISFYPICLGCDAIPQGSTTVWNPETGDISEDGPYINSMGDCLLTTNECLIPVRDESRPVSNDVGMIPPANVMTYVPDSTSPEDQTQVYFDPANLNLAHPYWVMDGRAYLLHNWNEPTATLVYRDGTEQVIDLPAELHVITGTPDGWLMQRNEETLFQFQVSDGEIRVTEYPEITGRMTLLDAPALGADDLPPVSPILK